MVKFSICTSCPLAANFVCRHHVLSDNEIDAIFTYINVAFQREYEVHVEMVS